MAEHVATSETLNLQVLIQIRNNLFELNQKQQHLVEKIDDASLRVVRLEERNFRFERLQEQVDTMDARIDVLLKDKDRRDGAISAWSWLLKNWPAVVAFFAMVAVVLRSNGKL